MFVTTAGRTTELMVSEAKRVAEELSVLYVQRNKQSVAKLQGELQSDCIVVGKERLEMYLLGESDPFFFHPNSAMFRLKRLMRGEHDPMVEAMGLARGKSVLDCTLGLGSDSIVASFVTGEEGRVTGVEANLYLAYLVRNGLRTWTSGQDVFDKAMRKVEVKDMHALDILKSLPDYSVDVVYMDPMFEQTILESDGIRGLSKFALHEDVTEEFVTEASRVARERVVLKDHFRSDRFEQFGFHVLRRPSSKFHFGYITK